MCRIPTLSWWRTEPGPAPWPSMVGLPQPQASHLPAVLVCLFWNVR